jgi:WD40 repeat protein
MSCPLVSNAPLISSPSFGKKDFSKTKKRSRTEKNVGDFVFNLMRAASFGGVGCHLADNHLSASSEFLSSSKRRKPNPDQTIQYKEVRLGTRNALSSEKFSTDEGGLHHLIQDIQFSLARFLPISDLKKLLELNKEHHRAWFFTFNDRKIQSMITLNQLRLKTKPVATLKIHQSLVEHLIKGDSLVASCDSNGLICLWDLTTEIPLLRLQIGNSVSKLFMDRDFLVAGLETGQIYVWRLEDLLKEPTLAPKVLTKHTSPISFLQIKENRLVSHGNDNYICSWNLENMNLAPVRAKARQTVCSVCVFGDLIFFAHANKLACFSPHQHLYEIPLNSGTKHSDVISSLYLHQEKLFIRMRNPLGSDRVIVYSIGNILKYIQKEMNTLSTDFEINLESLPSDRSLELVVQGQRLFAVKDEKTISVYSLTEKALLWNLVNMKGSSTGLRVENGLLFTNNTLFDLSMTSPQISIFEKKDIQSLNVSLNGKMVVSSYNELLVFKIPS